jgi:hypothetical protein
MIRHFSSGFNGRPTGFWTHEGHASRWSILLLLQLQLDQTRNSSTKLLSFSGARLFQNCRPISNKFAVFAFQSADPLLLRQAIYVGRNIETANPKFQVLFTQIDKLIFLFLWYSFEPSDFLFYPVFLQASRTLHTVDALQPRVEAILLLLLPRLCKTIKVYRSPRLV